jgi:RNA polymerase sigma factor (sigma-70 family)
MEIRVFEETVMFSARNNAAARHIHRLFAEGTISGIPDGQLLDRFLDESDEAAFAALVDRHGPMVLRTCRAVVRETSAAEDAFQATFLVLVCKARTIRGRAALGGWLRRVAYRIAIQASSDAARRRGREGLAGDLIVEDTKRDEPADDWCFILREEVARLSQKYRLPVLLCDLEGKTHAQAAAELKWGEATVRRRLAGAHDLLRCRLIRRGVSLTTAGLATALGGSANAGVPAAWVKATVKAASQLSTAPMRIAVGEAVSITAAALVRKSLRVMLLSKVAAFATVGIAVGLLGCVAWGVSLPRQAIDPNAGAMRKPRDPDAATTAHRKTDPPQNTDAKITYQGRVIDPEGRPFKGAALYFNSYALNQPRDLPIRATSGADGEFRFEVRKSEFDRSQDDEPWSFGTIEARAQGYARGIVNDRGTAKPLTLQLARDDVPISGRIIDFEGRPVAGVTVTVLNVRSTAKGSLDDWIKALEERKELYNLEYEFLPNRLERQSEPPVIPPVVTGPDGTVRLDGVGRERVSTLQVEGPTIETKQFEVRTRPGPAIRVAGYKGESSEPITVYGSSFEHVVGPTRALCSRRTFLSKLAGR